MTARDHILLAHGGGGRVSRDFIEREIVPRFGHGPLAALPDATTLRFPSTALTITTDSFVVQPLEFPGGDIGALSVHGTVNDLSVSGARPLAITLALILEEGFSLAVLRRILNSIEDAARDCGVMVAAGDTKVVPRGQGDGVYINTTGIGVPLPGFDLSAGNLRAGDRILVSGTLGEHGMAVMTARHRLALSSSLKSDSGSVHRLVASLSPHAGHIRFMRDPTRGGLAALVNEAVGGLDIGALIDENALPYSPAARAASEILGIDLTHVPRKAGSSRSARPTPRTRSSSNGAPCRKGKGARIVGEVTTDVGRVVIESSVGTRRLLDHPQGELLPRIC
ncbi:MAG: hydrogenase expression/formation protein HypE [Deltaproteobacteria bacterium]|nr:hydrogenase expression/formation protein HypE [Deltaproteobacteria bacterium]